MQLLPQKTPFGPWHGATNFSSLHIRLASTAGEGSTVPHVMGQESTLSKRVSEARQSHRTRNTIQLRLGFRGKFDVLTIGQLITTKQETICGACSRRTKDCATEQFEFDGSPNGWAEFLECCKETEVMKGLERGHSLAKAHGIAFPD